MIASERGLRTHKIGSSLIASQAQDEVNVTTPFDTAGMVSAHADPSRHLTVPVVSVIVVNYNGGVAVLECLRSLAAADNDATEVIVVDNASDDGSADVIEAAFPDIRLVRSGKNLGFGDGNNLGAMYASGRYLAFLNPDTIVEPDWLEHLIDALDSDAGAGMATSRILLLGDSEHINTCGNELHFTGLAQCRGMRMHRDAMPVAGDVAAVSGAAFVMRRSVFDLLGGFDGSFFLYMEDTDLSLRARLAGYRCLYVPTSVVYHHYEFRVGPSKIYYQERNRYLMLAKGLKVPTLVILMPALVLAEVVSWGFVILKHPRRSTGKLRAYVWVARHWKQIATARRQTQAIRRVPDREILATCSHRLAFDQVASGPLARLSHALLNPLFGVLLRVSMAVVRW